MTGVGEIGLGDGAGREGDIVGRGTTVGVDRRGLLARVGVTLGAEGAPHATTISGDKTMIADDRKKARINLGFPICPRATVFFLVLFG